MATTYTWDAFKSVIKEVSDDGTIRFIPTDPQNLDYAKIIAEGIEIEPYVAPTSQDNSDA